MITKLVFSQKECSSLLYKYAGKGLLPLFFGAGGFALGADSLIDKFPGGASGVIGDEIRVGGNSTTTVQWGRLTVTDGKKMVLSGEILNAVGEKGGTLVLKSNTQANKTSTWEISGDSSSADKFSGDVVLDDQKWGSPTLNLSGNKLSEATMNFSRMKELSGTNRYQLVLTGDAFLAGLEGGKDVNNASTNDPLVSGSGGVRVLTLQGGGTYDYTGEVGSNLSIIKNGSGTQTFSGKATSTDNSTLSVKKGVLEVAGNFKWGGAVSVDSSNEATLKVSNAWKVASGKSFTNNGLVDISGVGASLDITEASVSGVGAYTVNHQGELNIGGQSISGSVALLGGKLVVASSGGSVNNLSVSFGSSLSGALVVESLGFNLVDSFTGTNTPYLVIDAGGSLVLANGSQQIGLDLAGITGSYTEGSQLVFNLGLADQNSIDLDDFADSYGSWKVDGYDNGTLTLTYNSGAIPEPSTACLGLIGVALLGISRRRR